MSGETVGLGNRSRKKKVTEWNISEKGAGGV